MAPEDIHVKQPPGSILCWRVWWRWWRFSFFLSFVYLEFFIHISLVISHMFISLAPSYQVFLFSILSYTVRWIQKLCQIYMLLKLLYKA